MYFMSIVYVVHHLCYECICNALIFKERFFDRNLQTIFPKQKCRDICYYQIIDYTMKKRDDLKQID